MLIFLSRKIFRYFWKKLFLFFFIHFRKKIMEKKGIFFTLSESFWKKTTGKVEKPTKSESVIPEEKHRIFLLFFLQQKKKCNKSLRLEISKEMIKEQNFFFFIHEKNQFHING